MSLLTEWPLRKISEPHESNDVLLLDNTDNDEQMLQGNHRVRELVKSRQEEYAQKSRIEKPLVAVEILKQWRNQEPKGRFLIEESGSHPPLFKDVGDKKARNHIIKLLKSSIENENGHGSQRGMTVGHAQHSNKSHLDWRSVASKLYEREVHAEKLREAFERSRHPDHALSHEFVLICGPSGSGKSELARSIKDYVKGEGGFHIWGKYDQLRLKTRAYSAFFDAFHQFTRQTEFKDKTWKDRAKRRVYAAVGSELQILVEAMPFLQSFLDVKEPSDLNSNHIGKGSEKSKKRFVVTFRRFIRALLDPKYPIVLVLDDLQWVDAGSCDLLQSLVSPQFGNRQGLLIVATCRGNEISLNDLLSVHLRELEEKGTAITSIEVANLSVDTLTQMIVDAGMPEEQSSMLAEIVHTQTKGNAFFSTQYLQNLQEEGLLKQGASDTKWEFDEDELQLSSRSAGYDTQMVRLLAKKMMQLPPEVQDVLKVAACIGSEVRENLLFHACSVSSSTVLLALSVAEERGLIIYNFDAGRGRFAHDRFQEAAVSLISISTESTDSSLFQLQLGRTLRSQLSEAEFRKHLPLITSLMVQGGEHIKDEDEREKLARLCLAAARTVAKASAFNSAIHYIESGMTLLSSRHWRDQYDLSLLLYSTGCELAFCNGEHAAVEKLADEVAQNARSFDDKVQVYTTLILSLDARWKLEAATDECFRILDHCGERFPRTVGKTGILMDFLRTKRMLRHKTAHDILNLPAMTDTTALTAMSVIHLLYPIVLVSNFNLSPLTAFRMIRLTLQHGLSPMSSVGFAFYASVLVRFGKTREGLFYGKLARQIMEKYPVKEFEARTTIALWGNVMTESEPLRQCVDPYMSAHHAALSTGDFNSAMASMFCYCLLQLYTGKALSSVVNTLNHTKQLAEDYNQKSGGTMTYPLLQACHNLQDCCEDPLVLTGEAMDEDQWKAEMTSNHGTNSPMHAFLIFLKLIIAVYLNESEEAIVKEFRKQNPGVVIPYIYYYNLFYEGLIEASKTTPLSRWRARRNLRRLEKAMVRCPENFSSKVFLLRAEMASAGGHYEHALLAYDKAIHYAKKEGLTNEEALSNEKAAKMLLSSGNVPEASLYFEAALKCYRRWGADIKVVQLDQKLDVIGKL